LKTYVKTGFTINEDAQITYRLPFRKKQKPLRFNYLSLIWNVKVLLAKIKDCKGKELNFSTKKKLPTKTPPKIGENLFEAGCSGLVCF